MNKWGEKFNKIPFILSYIASYPKIANKFEDFYPYKIEKLKNSQLEWISLVAQLYNPIESNFFKDYWVPFQKNNFDYFIDLSSDSLPIFEANYFSLEPYRWYKSYYIKDLSMFLINFEKLDFNIESHFNKVKENEQNTFNKLCNERDMLGLSGKIKPKSINKENLFISYLKNKCIFRDNYILFKGISSLIVGLLPFDSEITLLDFNPPIICDNDYKKIKNIKSLLYLIQSEGWGGICIYSFIFKNNHSCRAVFKFDTFKIFHYNNDFLKEIFNKYEAIRNQ